MKKIIYIFSLMTLLLAGCQPEEVVAVFDSSSAEDGRRTITFSMDVPEFQVMSRAESATPINKIDLMVFGDNGYIETVSATNINGIKEEGVNPTGTFKATIAPDATLIHFIANYTEGQLIAEKGKTEDEVIPLLTASADNLVYWARNTIAENQTSVHVNFLRHLAKVTVEVSTTAIDGYKASDYFRVTDFVLCNYVNKGTIAPNNYIWGFETNPETVTEISNISENIVSGTEHSTAPDELYLAEYNNQEIPDDQVCVILAGQLKPQNADGSWNLNGGWGETKYYKVLLTDGEDNPYQIIRNVNYKIVIKQMQDVGAKYFNEAKEANPINNLYAYVMPESPSISDMDGNSLTVTPTVHLLTAEGSISSTVVTEQKTEEFANEQLKHEVVGDAEILSNISLGGGELTADVAAVTEIKKAQIRVKYGKLSRTVTVIASPEFTISANAYIDNTYSTEKKKTSYSAADEDVYFKFNLDTDYPSATEYPDLYPIKCYIRADNLYPVDNKNMLIDYEYKSGQYWYTYLAPTTGDHKIHFKTKLSTVNEMIEVESEYFGAAKVMLEGNNVTPQFSNLVINGGANGKVYWTSGQRTRTTVTFNTTTKPASISITVPGQMTGYESIEGYGTITNRIQNNNGTYTLTYVPASFGDQKIVLITDGNIHGNGTITLAAANYTSISGTYNNVLHVTGLKSTNGNDEEITVYHTSANNNNNIIGTCRFTDGNLENAFDITLQSGWTTNTSILFRYSRGWSSYNSSTTLGNINNVTLTFSQN